MDFWFCNQKYKISTARNATFSTEKCIFVKKRLLRVFFFISKLIYNLLNFLFQLTLPLLQWVSPKMKQFVQGRKYTLEFLRQQDFTAGNWYWFHCASLGEYEQAVPLILAYRREGIRILVSFFSPSGYEHKKNDKRIDCAIYLPVDTPSNARKLVKIVKPQKAFFVKYEFWENYFSTLNGYQIPLYMISSTFRSNQVFFKWYGAFFKNTLQRVTHFFVQNSSSQQVLEQNGFSNVTVSGDTRYDRVEAQLSINNKLPNIEKFINGRQCVVLGSTWPEDEDLFVNAIATTTDKVCFVIAPHEIKPEKIQRLANRLTVEVSLLSVGVDELAKVLIIDSIGLLTRIYSYADIAYVGGAAGSSGLHNILEPAVFGVPIIVGSNVNKFPEAKALQKFGGLEIVKTPEGFQKILNDLIANSTLRDKMSTASRDFVSSQVGATRKIISLVD